MSNSGGGGGGGGTGGVASVSPTSATLPLNQSKTFTAMGAMGATPTGVSWSLSGPGSLQPNGNSATYVAPADFPSGNSATITAGNGSGTATAQVTVVYPNNNANPEKLPIEMGTTGGNATDSTTSGNMITCCSGTLGSLVQRGGTLYILSNNHVLAKSGQGKIGDPVTQPGLIDNNCNPGKLVANLSQFTNLKTANADAALAQIIPGTVDASGAILDLGAAGATSIAAAPPSATLGDASSALANNEPVAKSGRSSGLTCSKLSSINTDVSVGYSNSCGGPNAFSATFTNQLMIGGASFSAAGDSGSLVVTADTARPLGLLFAGTDTTTAANPISDALNALKNSTGTPTMVGGGDHSVSCEPTASASSAQRKGGASGATLSAEQMQRANAAKEKYVAQLMANAHISGVGMGRSEDAPGEAAVVIYATQPDATIPNTLDGVRTKIIYGSAFTARDQAASATANIHVSTARLQQAIAAKSANAAAWMAQQGVYGFGVGLSGDDASEPALVVYVAKDAHAAIPAEIAGVRTRIIEEAEPFRAYGWNQRTQAAPVCRVPRKSRHSLLAP